MAEYSVFVQASVVWYNKLSPRAKFYKTDA
jgi:hypothetical protein